MRNGVLPQRWSPRASAWRRMTSQAQIRVVARWNCWRVSSRRVYRIRTAIPSSPDRPSTTPWRRRMATVKAVRPEVGLGLAAAGGEPEEVGHGVGALAPVGVVEPGEAGEVEQDERQLEGIPRAVRGDVHVVVVDVPAPPDALGEERAGPLEPHGVVHEPEGVGHLRVGRQQVEPLLDPLQRLLAPLDGRPRHRP